jgi:hypothetical protein
VGRESRLSHHGCLREFSLEHVVLVPCNAG